jgi:hypothetical protein
MQKPITTRTQGALDYTTVLFALAFPRLLGARPSVRRAVTCVALTEMAYALFTRQEYSAVAAMPMKAHLTIDAIGGAGLCAVPFVFNERKWTVTACCVGMGLFDIVVAPFTQTTPWFDRTEPKPTQYRVATTGGAATPPRAVPVA